MQQAKQKGNPKRNQDRSRSRMETQIESMIHLRTVQLVEHVLDGYEKRLNNYLEKSSEEFKEEAVKYTRVELTLERDWVLPNEQQKMNIEKLREIRVKDRDTIFKVVVRRKHYNENEKIEDYQVWGSTGIKTEFLNTKKIVETVVLESLMGYMAEKGIEYIEAERNIYRQVDIKEPLQEATQGESAQ